MISELCFFECNRIHQSHDTTYIHFVRHVFKTILSLEIVSFDKIRINNKPNIATACHMSTGIYLYTCSTSKNTPR